MYLNEFILIICPEEDYNKITEKLAQQALRERNKIPSKSVSKITKKDIIDATRLSLVTETITRKPIARMEGVMQIRFTFIKFRKQQAPLTVTRTGRSNKLFFPADNKLGFDLCLQRAMGQNIGFSPDEIIIKELVYVYWITIVRKK